MKLADRKEVLKHVSLPIAPTGVCYVQAEEGMTRSDEGLGWERPLLTPEWLA